MKKLSFFSLAVAGLLLGSCSNDEILDGGNPGANGSGTAVATAGYINLGINLPTSPVTAKDVPAFDDGSANEWQVNDAILVIFEKAADAAESTASVVAAYNLDDLKPWPTVDDAPMDQITSNANMVAEVPGKINAANTRYALVMLNAKQLFEVQADNTLKRKAEIDSEDYTVDMTDFADFTDDALALSDKVAADQTGGNKVREVVGFFMSNAPLYNAGEVNTLVPISDDAVCTTEEEAESKPATNVYVERAVSKVTIDGENFPTAVEEGTYAGDKVEIQEWGLDITNRSFYPVRNVTGFSTWAGYAPVGVSANRFYGNLPVEEAGVRTYWAVDPNYDKYSSYADAVADPTGTALAGLFNLRSKENTFDNLAAEEPQYCLENTFDINNQNVNQTTRVVFKALYTPKNHATGADFYSIGSSKDLYYLDAAAAAAGMKEWDDSYTGDGTEVENLVPNVVKGGIVSYLGNELHILNADQIESLTLPTFVQGANTLAGAVITYKTYSHEGSNHKVLYGSKADYEAATNKEDWTVSEALTISAEDLATLSANIGSINCYKGGVSYYEAPIRHFKDYAEVPYLPSTFENDYKGNAQDYLGRYGMVRNNWYQIAVHSVSGPGSADIPSRTPDTDDQVKFYVSVDVNVLSWALRTQDVDL